MSILELRGEVKAAFSMPPRKAPHPLDGPNKWQPQDPERSAESAIYPEAP